MSGMAMIFVNRDRQSLGQFTEQEVSNGLDSGQFLPTDLAWQEGMENWQPISSFTGLPPPGAATPANRPTPPAPETASADFRQPGKIRFDECLNSGWECFKLNWGLCVVATLVFFAISAVVQIPMQFAEAVFRRFTGHGAVDQIWILVAAGVVFLFFYVLATGVSSILSAGFLYFFVEALRTKKANIDNLFAGFRSPNWIQLLLAMLAWLLAIFLIVAVILAPGIFLSAMMKSRTPVLVSAGLLVVPVVYFSVGIGFVFPLIVDKKIGFWEAIKTSVKTVHRQWFRAFGLMVLVGLVAIVGLLACCVGMLATIPLAYLVWGQGYRQLFGDGELKPQD
ncbi:MAG: GYF domain-containing protein [Terrimicrobiaceae bacterium]